MRIPINSPETRCFVETVRTPCPHFPDRRNGFEYASFLCLISYVLIPRPASKTAKRRWRTVITFFDLGVFGNYRAIRFYLDAFQMLAGDLRFIKIVTLESFRQNLIMERTVRCNKYALFVKQMA